jgi:hypothetical protein
MIDATTPYYIDRTEKYANLGTLEKAQEQFYPNSAFENSRKYFFMYIPSVDDMPKHIPHPQVRRAARTISQSVCVETDNLLTEGECIQFETLAAYIDYNGVRSIVVV